MGSQIGALVGDVYNCAGYRIQMVLAEVFSMGMKAGVEPPKQCTLVHHRYDRFLPNKYAPPSFALKLGHKGMRLATERCRELAVQCGLPI
jgi:3-hydroxyisobutyrate dehydrogenase